MRFEIAVHAQRGRMRSDLSQQPTLDEKPQIVVDRGERNGWNATPDRGVNVFRRIVSVGSDDGLIDHLTLVRDRQTVLRGQLTELFMGEAHDYWMRIIIKRHLDNPAEADTLNKGSREILNGVPQFDDESPRFEDWSPEKQRTAFEGMVREDIRTTAIKATADEFILLHPEMPDHIKNGEAIAKNLKLMFGDIAYSVEHFEAAYDVARANGALELDQAVIAKQQQKAMDAKRKAAQDKRNFEAKRQFNPEEDYSNLSLDEIRQRADVGTQRELERRAYQEGLR